MVDIRADVTPAVLKRIRDLGGTVITSVPKYRAIRAQLPLRAVEMLASLDAIRTIRPADEARTRAQASPFSPAPRTRKADFPVARKDNTSAGDVAHRANLARRTHSVDGTGIGIGVISNGVRSLADRQASGDLPARVTVLPGQAGAGDEGTALLEVVHDLAPGAELYFATGFRGPAQMAVNIEALCEAGANVIVDDVGYTLEAVFQDDVVAQGINAAVADGCAFFSSGGNEGNLTNGTSAVWEGDYAAGTSLIVDGETLGVRHDFGGGMEANEVTGFAFIGVRTIVLQWADPLGASSNDYDLFLVNEDGDVIASSTNISGRNTRSDRVHPFTDIRLLRTQFGRRQGLWIGPLPARAGLRRTVGDPDRRQPTRPLSGGERGQCGDGRRAHRRRVRQRLQRDRVRPDGQLGRSAPDLLPTGRDCDHAKQFLLDWRAVAAEA